MTQQPAQVSERLEDVDGVGVFWREAPAPAGSGAEGPVLYLHGVPENSDAWLPFLALTGGLAPDLPGFGRSGKPASRDYTIDECDHFVERFLEHLGIERLSMVMHDWGAVGLGFAQRHPERIERLVLINVVPFLPGYRWHRIARVWRTPGAGELALKLTNRATLTQGSRESNVTPGPMPAQWLDSVLDHFDQGTQRAIVRLYRSAPPQVLAAAGSRLHSLQMPALVAWGMADPYIPGRFAAAYAATLGRAELLELADAGHNPWLDRPDLIDTIAAFLRAGAQ
jgi:pimeloyl-ACP methyl ester carboxylesterase